VPQLLFLFLTIFCSVDIQNLSREEEEKGDISNIIVQRAASVLFFDVKYG